MPLSDFGTQLNYWLNVKALSQADFARMMGVSRSTVYQWIMGQREPTNDTFFKICDVLEVTYFDLNFSPSNLAQQELNILFMTNKLHFTDYDDDSIFAMRNLLVDYLLKIEKDFRSR